MFRKNYCATLGLASAAVLALGVLWAFVFGTFTEGKKNSCDIMNNVFLEITLLLTKNPVIENSAPQAHLIFGCKHILASLFSHDLDLLHYILDASEIAQAKLKGLDQTKPNSSPKPPKPPKDVNTFQNNQVKYAGGASAIPPDQMKCNILKAKRDEEMKNAAVGGYHIYSAVSI